LSLLRTPTGGAAGERPERTARVVAGTVRYRCATMTVARDAALRALFDRVAVASRSGPDLQAIGAALLELAADSDDLARWVEQLGDRSGSVAMHASEEGPRLSLVHRTEGQMSAVHDHGVWVAIAPVTGLESHRRWRVDPADGNPWSIQLAEQRDVRPGDAVTLLPPDDIHDHGHLPGHGAPAHILVLLGDRQTRYARNEWDLATGRHRLLAPGDGGRFLASEAFPG
jgi:predicted metal-dependent enzyme (double-stranded beta helix superfamily)